MCWTCFLPRTMKVRDQTGWRGPSAQWQVGLPQRRWERQSEPGSRSSGRWKRRASSNLRWRSREASGPLGSCSSIILWYTYHKNSTKANLFFECENRKGSGEPRGNAERHPMIGFGCGGLSVVYETAGQAVAGVILSGAKDPCSLSPEAEGKGQLQRSFARPKARRAQDDRRLQVLNAGLSQWRTISCHPQWQARVRGAAPCGKPGNWYRKRQSQIRGRG